MEVKELLKGLGVLLAFGLVMTGLIALDGQGNTHHLVLAQPVPSPSPSPSPHYLAAFAPVKTCPGERLTFVNPAMVIRLDDREVLPAWDGKTGITRLTLADGETVRACGSLVEVAKVLRVSVWLEETGGAAGGGQ